MKAHYLVQIADPQNHHVKVTLKLQRPKQQQKLKVFLPSWSPGSYLMREYPRHIRRFEASQQNGEILFYAQLAKGIWEIDWQQSGLKTEQQDFQVVYEVYCKELTVRTSHIDASHAFLHGPSYLMGVVDEQLEAPTIEFRFPPLWSKLSTGLKDISGERSEFLYRARDYDELIDTPVEIGCHETDGFLYRGKPHHLAYYGELYPHTQNLKGDLEKVVDTVARHFDYDLPYDDYLFITHFVPKLYGGLEHLNSTTLQFDGRKLVNRKDYLSYLSLAGHEYFHLWNVKRIRPRELGPFDYLSEAYTSMLWLAEGLTSFMDDLFLYRAGVATLEEYLEMVKANLEAYLNTPGRYHHSLEQSSFNAWIKLYRPDENSRNSSVSYYLKGGLVFCVLHALLLEQGKSINDLLKALWQSYKQRPLQGLNRQEVYAIIQQLGGETVKSRFSSMVETTEDIDWEQVLKGMGCQLKWADSSQPYLGVEWDFQADRAHIKSVLTDSPAYRAGLNAGDEIIFLNGQRFLREDAEKLSSLVLVERPYQLVVCRLGRSFELEVTFSKGPRQLKEITIVDRALAEKSFAF
jgi:predicted metalloprotease with PDZ domain